LKENDRAVNTNIAESYLRSDHPQWSSAPLPPATAQSLASEPAPPPMNRGSSSAEVARTELTCTVQPHPWFSAKMGISEVRGAAAAQLL